MPPGIGAALDIAFLCLALAGHIAMGVAFFNQMHSAWLPPHLVHKLERAVMLLTGLVPFLLSLSLVATPLTARGASRVLPNLIGAAPWSWIWLYLAPCAIFGLFSAARWIRNRWSFRAPKVMTSNRTLSRERVASQDGPIIRGLAGFIASLPGNEALEIRVEEKCFSLPRWPMALADLRIVHLSDLHLSGRVSRAYFQRAVEIVNGLRADLIVISGDICEQETCLPWLDDFRDFQATSGAFFVLGNHDLRIHSSGEIRNRLAANGLVDLGGRWLVHSVRGIPLILAGNELPWFAPAAPMERCPQVIDGVRPPRIVVSHSPDQLTWARSFEVDLLLAGHTHGGQVRLPWIGPLVAPSRFGVKYASGEFYEAPTLMHVSRGLSSLQPLRFGCPPEISLLILSSGFSQENHDSISAR